MGNNEITKIILLEKEIHCIFMAGALCMLTARGKKKIQLSSTRLSLFSSSFFFLTHSFPLASVNAKTRACEGNTQEACRQGIGEK